MSLMCRCEALAAIGEFADNSERQAMACEFLLKHQHEDGGWGESYLSSQDKVSNQIGLAAHLSSFYQLVGSSPHCTLSI